MNTYFEKGSIEIKPKKNKICIKIIIFKIFKIMILYIIFGNIYNEELMTIFLTKYVH